MWVRVLFCAAVAAVGTPLDLAPALAAPEPRVAAAPAPPSDLEARIPLLARSFDGEVGIAVEDLREGWTVDWNGRRSFPQQSVAKLWTVLAALDAVDSGRLNLDDAILVTPGDLSVFNEPLASRVWEGSYSASVRELLALAIIESDNAANDILVRRLGGREAVQAVMARKGLPGISAGVEQRLLQSRIAGMDWRPELDGGFNFEAARARVPYARRAAAMRSYLADPDDGAEPLAMAHALAALDAGQLLSPASTALLLDLMRRSVHGPERLKGGLPPGWTIAHKTGTGQHLGLLHVGANDVGVITAPDGHSYAVAVFVGQSIRPLAWREALMRNVARSVVAHWRSETQG